MSATVVHTLELNSIEKIFCAHGNWSTIIHAAHLIGDHLKLTANLPQVCDCLLKRYPLMRARVRIESNRYLLDFFDYSDKDLFVDSLYSIRELDNSESWQKVVEDRCNQNPYSNNGTIIFPLFHFMLVFNKLSNSTKNEDFHLLLFSNHCVSDGRSGFILIHDFLTLATSPNLSEISEPAQTDVLPSISALIPRPYGPLYPLISFIAKYFVNMELRKLRNPHIPIKMITHVDSASSPYHIPQYKLKFLFASTSTDLFPNLHKQCRSMQVTLHGPLLACLLLAIEHLFPHRETDRLHPFKMAVPVDMRAHLPNSPLTPSSVGFFVGSTDIQLKHSLPLRSTPFWSVAQKCIRMTRKALSSSGIPLIMNIASDLMRREQDFNRLTRLFPDGHDSEFGFSNIGKYPYPCDYNHGLVQLRGMHVSDSSSVYRTSTTVFVTCVGNAQLDFSLAHGMETEEKAQEFLNYYIRLVETCANSELCTATTTLIQLLEAVKCH